MRLENQLLGVNIVNKKRKSKLIWPKPTF